MDNSNNKNNKESSKVKYLRNGKLSKNNNINYKHDSVYLLSQYLRGKVRYISLSSITAWSICWVPGQPGLQGGTLYKNNKNI